MPIRTPPVWLVCPVPTTARASPKSATFTTPSVPMSTFSGLMSRCTMPARWAAVSPDSTGSSTAKASATVSRPRAVSRSRSVRPRTSSMTRNTRPWSLPWSLTPTTFGWLSIAAARASRVNRSTNVGSCHQVVGHDLDRDRLVQAQVGGGVDGGHAATGQPLLEAVTPLEGQAHHGVGHRGVHPTECRSGIRPDRPATRWRWRPVLLVRVSAPRVPLSAARVEPG